VFLLTWIRAFLIFLGQFYCRFPQLAEFDVDDDVSIWLLMLGWFMYSGGVRPSADVRLCNDSFPLLSHNVGVLAKWCSPFQNT